MDVKSRSGRIGGAAEERGARKVEERGLLPPEERENLELLPE